MTEPAPTRKLTLFDATLLVMGGIIGVGIFFNPHTIATRVPVPWLYFALWIFGGLVAIAAAFTFAELGGSFPRAGGWFVYLRAAFGPFAAFLFAWVVLFTQSPSAIASIAKFCAERLHILIPAWVGGKGSTSETVAAAVLIVAVTAVALTGVKRAALVQNVCMLTKLLVIAALIVGGLAFVRDAPAPAPVVDPALAEGTRAFTWSGLILALLPLFYTLGGWQLAGYLAPELKDPVRTLPRAVLLGVLGVVVVYLAVNASYLAVLGIEGLAADKDFAQTLSNRAFGAFGAKVLAAGMTISAFGICAVNIIATPWLYVAIAKEGLFFRTVGEVSPVTGVPVRALCIQGVLTCVYLLSSLQDLVDSCVFVEWIFHFLAALALIRLRRLLPDLPRPVKTPLYPLLPLLYLATAAVIVIGTLYTAPPFVKYSGSLVVALGAIVYWPWRAYFRRGAQD